MGRFLGPNRKASDQGSWFGLVASVPLHICQLQTQWTTEKTAVTERPADEGPHWHFRTAFTFTGYSYQTHHKLHMVKYFY